MPGTGIPMHTTAPDPTQDSELDSSLPGSWHYFLLSWGGQFCPKDMSVHVWLFLVMLFPTGSKIALSFS